LPADSYWQFIRALRKKSGDQKADDYVVRFAAIGLGEGNLVYRDRVAATAVAIHLDRGETDQAKALAETIDDVSTIADMLTRKRYAKLWPAIEARAGTHMSGPANAYFVSAEGRLRREPDVFESKRDFLHAAVMAGKLAEGERVAALFAATPEDMVKLDQDGGWMVNEHAILLRAMKRQSDADARYAAMRAIKIADKPWLISMIINRAEYLVQDQAFAKAAPLVEEAETLAKTYGSPYAQQLIRRLKLCAAARTKAETGPALADLLAHKEDSRGVTAEGLICVNREDDAAALVIAELQSKDGVASMISELQPPESIMDRDPSVWRKPMNALLKRADVAAAFDKVGRVLPTQFWPE
jgi:hypothetical protein